MKQVKVFTGYLSEIEKEINKFLITDIKLVDIKFSVTGASACVILIYMSMPCTTFEESVIHYLKEIDKSIYTNL